MLTLKGRTCVFAGATGRIGRGAVKALAEQGMNVVMVTHNPENAGALMDEMKGLSGQVSAVSNTKSNEAIFAEVRQRFGSVDVVISSTGGLLASAAPEKISDACMDQILHHQITETYNMIRSALPYLKNSQAPRIILTSSAGALDGFEGEHIADSAARGGVISMTYTLARTLIPYGITVNCIARSGMINDFPPKDSTQLDVENLLERLPLGRPGTADEYGALVEYIASEEAALVTGHVFNLTGGLHIG